MKIKQLLFVMLIGLLAVLALTGCGKDDNIKTFYVGPEQVDCEGEGPMKCLLVKEDPDGDYLFFYSHIQGFEWEAGYEYELRVKVNDVENPPAGGSSLRYELVKLVSKTPVE